MTLIDKLLFALLIIMLPLGLVAAKMVNDSKQLSTIPAQQQQEITALIEKIESAQAGGNPGQVNSQPFTISAVVYASEAGTLTVSGTAPSARSLITVSATVLPSKETVDADELVLGNNVEIKAFSPDPSKSFMFTYPVEETAAEVELRFEQNASVHTIRFDVVSNKQIPTTD